jgi:hypothetical protein
MNSLYEAVDDYLELRRALGFKLRDYGVCLRELVSFLESKGSSRITTKLAVEFAKFAYERKNMLLPYYIPLIAQALHKQSGGCAHGREATMCTR